jgi:hypothetical protein
MRDPVHHPTPAERERPRAVALGYVARRFPIFVSVWFLGLAACGAPTSTNDRGGSSRVPVSPASAAGSGSATPVSLTSCTQMNQTAPCRCGAMPGRQVCNGASWGVCECAADVPGGATADLEGNGRSDIKFAWQRTPTGGADVGGCLPGDYEGNFGGIYWSYIATLAPIDDLAVPIANIDLPDQPSGFHFTVAPAQGGETVLKIKGVMNGTADLTFPFTADLDGELDCKSKTFTANMSNGTYSVLIEGLVAQTFLGLMHGRYDVHTHTFVDGDWDVWEISGQPPGTQAPALPRDFKRDGFGGYGTWAAALPTDTKDPKIIACPTNYSCASGPLGPNKLLCNSLLGPPGCTTDADCDGEFPGAHVSCLKATAFSTCLMECKP